MEEIESYDLTLTVKQLKLSVKFPCRLTLQHQGRPISPEIQSNNTNVFTVNRDVSIKEDKNKNYVELNVNLATDKGGNIMAGIIKINLRDINSSEGQSLTISLQKCLDPYATCLLTVKSVKINRTRVRKNNEQGKGKSSREFHFESRSQAPALQIKNFRPRPKYNQAQGYVPESKKSSIGTFHSPMASQLKQKALSMVGFRGVNNSFDRDQLANKYKHLGRRDNEDSKTVTGKWKEPDHAIKASMEASEKTLKLQILKYKTKYEQTDRNIEEKSKQIKDLKDQLAEMSRQLTEKQYLVEELNTKNNQISKLQETNKSLLKQIHEEKNRNIDLERALDEEKNINYNQMSRVREDADKKQHEMQKSIYEKRQELKEVTEENHYKANQINKMKNLIQDLESNLQMKTYEYEKMYSHERSEHNKTKTLLQQKINDLTNEVKKQEDLNNEKYSKIKQLEEENSKLSKKIGHLEDALLNSEQRMEEQSRAKEELSDQKKRLQKSQEQLHTRIKNLQRELSAKEKDLQQLNSQINEATNISKRKINELIEKNKAYATKTQELQNKVNVLSAQEEKLKRNLEMSQKENKMLQQNEKIAQRNLKHKDERILQLQKEVTQNDSKYSMKDNLSKKEAEYKTIQFEKMSHRVIQLEKNYQKEKQTAQQRRLDILKAQNKVRMLEENISRLNEQIREIKANQIKKQDELTQKIKELKNQIKTHENKYVQATASIHAAQLEKLNLKNELGKHQKTIQNYTDKLERLKRKQGELEMTIKNLHGDIDAKNQEIVQIQGLYKSLENDFKAIQADKSKTQKISTIINQEKVMAVSDINKLKRQIENREKKEQQYIGQIKNLKEQIIKLELKTTSVSKQYQKFKTTVSESIKSSFTIKNSLSSFENIMAGLDLSRAMNRSRTKAIMDYSITVQSNENKFGEAIENYARQSQQHILILSEELKKIKKEKQNTQKEFHALQIRSKEIEQDYERKLNESNSIIDSLNSQAALDAEQFEDKTFNYQRQLKKRDKSIQDLLLQLEDLRETQVNEATSHDIQISELFNKINALKSKITDHEMKEESHTYMFVNLQEKLSSLEVQNTELIHQNSILADHLNKKQKECLQRSQYAQDIERELDSIKKAKTDMLGELLSIKESFAIEKENNKRLNSDIKEEQMKNMQLKMFNAQLLKEKELLIRKEVELSEKVNSLQQKIQIYTLEISEKSELLSKRQTLLSQNREEIKMLRMEGTSSQGELSDIRLDLQRERQKVKDRERKISEKEEQIQHLNNNLKKITSKFETQIATLTEESQTLATELKTQKNDKQSKCQDYESEIRKLRENEAKLNEANIALQELMFFEKQTNSLNTSKFEQLQHQISKLNIESDKLNMTIVSLNEELKEKEEAMFALSGKLFTAENKLQSKEQEFKSRLQKVELDWRYKIDQICEEYENKLEIMEHEKSYVKNGMDGYSETVQKLQQEKTSLRQEIQTQRQSWQAKLKKVEEEKLVSLIDKNRQIEKIRQVFEQLEEKLKRKDFEIKAVEDDKRKVQQKLKEMRHDMQKAEEKHNQTFRNMERDADQNKRKQGQLKRFKQALKNNQWAVQREIKKSIQACGKSVVGYASQERKEDVMTLMRNLQVTIAKMAIPNIDEM